MVGEHGLPSSVDKCHLLVGLALQVGDLVHVLADEIPHTLVRVKVLLTVRLRERSSGDVGISGALLRLHGVLHDVHLKNVLCCGRVQSSKVIECLLKMAELII